MADEKNTEKKDGQKKPARKPAARKTSAKPSSGSGTRKATPKKETATKGSGTAAKATSKTADSKASKASTAKKPAAETAAKKPAARKAPAKKAPAKAAKRTAATKTAAGSKAETRAKRTTKKEAPERPVVNARARFVRVAPRKARLVADQVRGLPLEDALPLLRFSTRSAAQDIRKLLESAAANAENNHDLVADDLLVKDIHVDEGPTLRRYRPRALGRATRINKRTSHIAVALTPEE
jgi:ribosomal protein L22